MIFNVLYLRDKKHFDEKMRGIISTLGENTKFRMDSLSKIDWEKPRNGNLDALIVLGGIERAIVSGMKRKPTLIIEITNDEGYKQDYLNFSGCFVEKIPLPMAEERPEHLLVMLQRHRMMVNQHNLDRQFLNSLFSLIPDGLVLTDVDGVILESNARLTGLSFDRLIGRKIYDFLDDSSKEMIKQKIRELEKTDSNMSIELDILGKNREKIPTLVNSRFLKNREGIPQHILTILTNISAQKRIWEKEQFLSNIIDSSYDGIVGVDENNRVTLWNKGAEKIFGFSAPEVLGRDIFLFAVDEKETMLMKNIFDEVKSKGVIQNLLVNSRKKDGVIQIEITLSVMKDEKGNYKGLSATIRDVSQVQKYLNEAREKNAELEHLINVVSHDLRSPLHSLDAYLSSIQELSRNKLQDEDILEMFERMHANLTNMETLIQDLTDFSRVGLDSDEEIAVDLNSIVEDIVNDIQWQVGKKNFQVKIQKMPTIRINPGRIYQVFENLLNNAYKFRKEGETAIAEISSAQDNEKIYIQVKDYGIGIHEKYRDKIFNLFYRSKEKSVEGSGAGLAITRKIITGYGGEIWVDSEPGKGSMFKFSIPLVLQMKQG